MNKSEILSALKNSVSNKKILLPKYIDFSLQNKILTMTLMRSSCYGFGSKCSNMQEDNNAFESWALAIYAALGREQVTKVILAVHPDAHVNLVDFSAGAKNGHYGRFLYRALRFSQQYHWFELAPEVQTVVDTFERFLNDNSFINTFSTEESSTKARRKNKSEKSESQVEAEFADVSNIDRRSWLVTELRKQGITIQPDTIFRQLAVGLYKYDGDISYAPHEINTVFVGHRAAVDLWAIAEDTLIPFELKTESKMLGALTELFFYCNCLYDVYINRNNMRPIDKEGNDGYKKLLMVRNTLKKVMGFMLLDKQSIHPLMTKEMLAEMNNSSQPNIRYGDILEYEI